MSQRSPAFGLPVLPTRLGLVAGSAVLGSVALVAVVATSSRPFGTFAGATAFAVFFGVMMWLVQRRSEQHQLEGLARVPGVGHEGARRALLLGLVAAVALAVAEVLVFVLFSWIFGRDAVDSIAGGILLGLALWQVLHAKDLRRWQRRHAAVLCMRADARRFALTRRQASAQLVAVVRDGVPTP